MLNRIRFILIKLSNTCQHEKRIRNSPLDILMFLPSQFGHIPVKEKNLALCRLIKSTQECKISTFVNCDDPQTNTSLMSSISNPLFIGFS